MTLKLETSLCDGDPECDTGFLLGWRKVRRSGCGVEAYRRMIKEGADIIDVGGESTRPGHVKISVAEEIERTCFVIEAIKERFEIPVSLDTYKYQVAQAGILAGADLINDIWGFKWDDEMAPLCAKYQIPVCLMHNRKEAVYNDFIADVIADMKECVQIAHASGLADVRSS